jgi:tripartite-type tricarboxylate transporter receptor subunit TctC
MLANLTASLTHVRDGSIKANTRSTATPNLPTTDEAGLPGFYVTPWIGLLARKGTPKNVIAKLNSAVVSALADPTTRIRLTDLGMEIFWVWADYEIFTMSINCPRERTRRSDDRGD